MGFMRVIWSAAQREFDGAMLSHPMTWRYLKYALLLLLFQPIPVPLALLPFCFLPGTPQFRSLVNACTHAKTSLVWEHIDALWKARSFNLLESLIGGAQRLVETVFDLPEFTARLGGSSDVGTLLRTHQFIILDGSDAEPEARTAIYRAWNLMIFSFLKQNYAETGQPCYVLVVWDEAPATNVLGPFEINMLREGRKMGFAGWIAGQDLSFLDPLLKKAVKSTAPEHVWHNPGEYELAMEAAWDIGLAILDPHKVHHSVYKQRHAGYEPATKRTKSVTEFEGDRRITISDSETQTARYEDFQENVYQNLTDQITLTAQKHIQMGPGWRTIRTPEFVTPEPVYTPMLPDEYPEDVFPELAAKKIARAIAISQARPEFTTPVDVEDTWVHAITTDSEKTGMIVSSRSSGAGTKRPRNNSSKRASFPRRNGHGGG
jgi:hypothetical protein